MARSILRWCRNSWRAVLAEFFATMFLLFFGCLSLCKSEEKSILSVAIAFGLVVGTNVQIFGHISGAHMNPAVSIAAAIFGRSSIPLMITYIITQCAGAIAGFGLLKVVLPDELKTAGMCVTVPHKDINVFRALSLEALLTAVLVLVCCSVWDFRNISRHDSAPIKFGLAVMVLVVISGNLTGCSINPARSLGPAIWNNMWESHWVYWVGPLVGGSIAATFYTLIWQI